MDNQKDQPKPQQYVEDNQKLNPKQYKPIKQDKITDDNQKNNQKDDIDKVVYLVDKPNNPTILNDSNIPTKEEVNIQEPKQNKTTNYLAVTLLATLLYVTCAWVAQAQLVQIIDLEVPLVVLLSLIITYVAKEKQLTIYGIYIILAAIIYPIGAQYSFIISLALMSHVFIYCIEKIQTNERDFKVNTIS